MGLTFHNPMGRIGGGEQSHGPMGHGRLGDFQRGVPGKRLPEGGLTTGRNDRQRTFKNKGRGQDNRKGGYKPGVKQQHSEVTDQII